MGSPRKRAWNRAGVLFLLTAVFPVCQNGQAQIEFGAPAALNTNAGSDSGQDQWPDLTTDGLGNWVAVWHSDDDLGGTVGSDFDILVARSTGNGVTWTPPAVLNVNAGSDSGHDHWPQVATDGSGHWVTVWSSSDSLGGTIGADNDILVATSTDDGATWTPPAALNGNAVSDSATDYEPHVTSDGLGHWVAVWHAWEISVDPDVFFACSTDNGLTWTAPAALNTNAASDAYEDLDARVTTDGAGHWITVWLSVGVSGMDYDIFVARSTDNGTTWTAPEALNTNAATDSNSDVAPQVMTDGAGCWVAVWETMTSWGGSVDINSDILSATSTDNGVTWTAPVPVNSSAGSDSGDDFAPEVATDGTGHWVAVWHYFNASGGPTGTDCDVLTATSTDNGATWSPAVNLNPNAASDSGNDQYAQVTADGAGHWVAAWQSADDLGGTIGTDGDILVSTAGVTPTLPAASTLAFCALAMALLAATWRVCRRA